MEGEVEEVKPGPSNPEGSSRIPTVQGALTQQDFDKYFDVSDQELLIAASQYEVCHLFTVDYTTFIPISASKD